MGETLIPVWTPDRTEWASDHFRWDELACHDKGRTPYPADYRDDPEKLPKLLRVLECIRRVCCGNTAVMLDSVYRTWAHNRAVGGAKQSQHVAGTAADLRSLAVAVAELFQAIVALARTQPDLGIRYVKGYANRAGARIGWVHVDVGVKSQSEVMVEWED